MRFHGSPSLRCASLYQSTVFLDAIITPSPCLHSLLYRPQGHGQHREFVGQRATEHIGDHASLPKELQNYLYANDSEKTTPPYLVETYNIRAAR
jgi:hypothetical protein